MQQITIAYYLLVPLLGRQASRVALVVKNLPANAVGARHSLGPVDPLEEEMATCSSILAWKIP